MLMMLVSWGRIWARVTPADAADAHDAGVWGAFGKGSQVMQLMFIMLVSRGIPTCIGIV